jgi:Carboxypeptidase regulatory-like domain
MLKFVSALALVLLFASASAAQITGSITGTITDSSNAVLPGVRVTATSPAMMGAQVAVSNDQGVYRFPSVPVGTYNLKYELSGFGTINREGIVVTIGFTATVLIQMKVASLSEAVTVTGESPVVDVKNTNIQTNVTKDMLEAMPNSRDIWTVIGQAPGFMVTSFDVGGSRAGTQTGYSAFGYSGQVRVQVDGVNTTEGTGGAGFYYDYGSFQELQLTGDGADASATTPGVQLNALIRSGGNQFKGDMYFDYENRRLQGFNVTDQLRRLGVNEGTRILLYRDPNFTLGGPIKRDKMWFFTSIRDQRTGQTVDNFPVENPGGFFFETRLTNVTYKINYQLSQNNRLGHYIQWGRKFQPHRGAGSTAYSDAPFRQDSWSWAANLDWNSIIGSKFFHNTRYSTFGYDWPNYAYGLNGEVSSNIRQRRTESLTGNTAGGAAEDWTYRLRHQFDWTGTYFKDRMPLFKGNHGLKFGVVSEWETLQEIDYGFKDDISLSFSSVAGEADFTRPFRVTIRNTDRYSENASWHHGIFITDQWQINSKLTANVGVRWDYYSSYFPDQEIMNGPFRDYFYAGQPIPIRDGNAAPSTHSLAATPYAGTWVIPGQSDIRTHASIAPRVGFAYDIRGKGKTVVKFNWGRFYFNTGTASSGINPAQSLTSTFDWIDRNGDRQFQLGDSADTYELGRFRSTTGATTALIDPNIKHSYTDSTSIWLEHELVRDIAVRVGYTYKSDGNSSAGVQLNRVRELYTSQVSVADPGPDGLLGNGDDGPNFIVWDIPSPVPSSRTMTATVDGIIAVDRAFDITLSRRMRNNWSIMTNFLYNWDHDRGFAQNPNQDRFNDNTVTLWAFKVVGSYRAPKGFVISPSLRHQAGDNLARIVPANSGVDPDTGLAKSLNLTLNYQAEREGAYREDNITIFDIRVEKRVRVPNLQGHELGLFFDVFNIANSNASQSADNTVGRRTVKLTSGEVVEYARFLRPTGVLSPRIFRLGIKYQF